MRQLLGLLTGIALLVGCGSAQLKVNDATVTDANDRIGAFDVSASYFFGAAGSFT
jgi:hypothetical protein